MAGVTRVKIRESIEELASQLQVEPNPDLKERLQVLYAKVIAEWDEHK